MSVGIMLGGCEMQVMPDTPAVCDLKEQGDVAGFG